MKVSRLVFLFGVFLVLFLSVISFDAKSAVSEREKRPLAPFPALRGGEGSFFARVDLYLEDRIGLKFQYKKLHEALNALYQVENDAKRAGFVGKDGWLFSNGDGLLENWQKTNLLGEEALSYYCGKIVNMSSWCRKNGMHFIFYVAPNKYEIYGEFYPFQPRPEGRTLAEQVVSRLRQLGVDAVYPRELLLEEKRRAPHPIYYERDTHWNKLGAYHGSRPLVERIRALFPERGFPAVSYTFERTDARNGDLEPLIGTAGAAMTDYAVRPFLDGEPCAGLYRLEAGSDPHFFATRSDGSYPRLVMFRDSFGNSLYPYIAPYFSRGEYWWRFPSEGDKPYLAEYKPDLVIFEVVERHMQYVRSLTEFSDG